MTDIITAEALIERVAEAMHGQPDRVDVKIMARAAILATLEGLPEIQQVKDALSFFSKRAAYFDGKVRADGESWADEDEYADDEPSTTYLGNLRAARDALKALNAVIDAVKAVKL